MNEDVREKFSSYSREDLLEVIELRGVNSIYDANYWRDKYYSEASRRIGNEAELYLLRAMVLVLLIVGGLVLFL